MSKRTRTRQRQRIGYIAGFVLVGLSLLFAALPGNERLSAAGPANTGHETLACTDCHLSADGSELQQINANLRYLLNLRTSPVPFGHHDVDNGACLDCHNRPNDRHPTHRFEEPRFKEAQGTIAPQKCESCHLEHNGVRVTPVELTFCMHCHSDMELNNDPIDVPHVELVQAERWDSCLGCHDYHGNHVYEVPTSLADAHTEQAIQSYFLGAASPFGDEHLVPARTTRSSK